MINIQKNIQLTEDKHAFEQLKLEINELNKKD